MLWLMRILREAVLEVRVELRKNHHIYIWLRNDSDQFSSSTFLYFPVVRSVKMEEHATLIIENESERTLKMDTFVHAFYFEYIS